MAITFSIDMVPVGKGRPRFGGGRVFTPKKTLDAESKVAKAAKAAMLQAGISHPLTGPVTMEVTAVFPVPKSYTKRQREEINSGLKKPAKPDLDNVVKLLGDAMNGIVFVDDSQVCRLVAQKMYGESAQLLVSCSEHQGD